MGDEIEGFELSRQYLLPVDLEGKTGQIQYGLILETEHDETVKMVQKVILHHLYQLHQVSVHSVAIESTEGKSGT